MLSKIERIMKFEEYSSFDATGLSHILKQKEVTPLELTRIAAEAIETYDPKLEAVVETFEDVVEQPTRDGMDPSGVFSGVPMLLKDLGSTLAGRKQAQGISWLASHVAEHTDPLVDNFSRAGLTVLGRSATPELGLSFDTSSPAFGITRNPWNRDFTPGGSSGGSAAAVSAGLVPIASASDGGGSIRFPAGWTGLVGLKTTRGLLPLPRGVNESSLYVASEGVLTRSVRDTALAYDQLWRKPLGWGFVDYGEPGWRLCDELAAEPRSFRVALSTGRWGFDDSAPDASVKKRIEAMARALENLGHRVEEIKDDQLCDFHLLWQSYESWGWTIPCSETLAELSAAMNIEPAAADSSPQLLHHLQRAGQASAADVLTALTANATVTRQWGEFWETGFDLLLCPVSAIACPAAGGPYSTLDPAPFDEWFGRLMRGARYTVPGNEVGLPSIALPAGPDTSGLPIGAQLYAPWRHENDLIHIAAQLERDIPEHFTSRPDFVPM